MKKNKLIKKLIIICAVVILIELISMLIIKIFRERDIDHVDTVNDIVLVDDGYIVVGMSDFDNSKEISKVTYEYTNSTTNEKMNVIANQAKIAKLDKDKNLIWEKTFDNTYDSSFYGILKLSDGYIAVGSLISRYEQIEANTRDALIVKYDSSGEIIFWKA